MLQLSVLYEVIGEFWEIDPYNAKLKFSCSKIYLKHHRDCVKGMKK